MIEVDLTTEVLFQNLKQGIYKLWQTLQNSLYNLKLIMFHFRFSISKDRKWKNLFLCFINDIPEGITSLYVDDIYMHLILSIGGGKHPLE